MPMGYEDGTDAAYAEERARLNCTECQRLKTAIQRIRHIKDKIPFDAADAVTECIRIAKEALGEKTS